MAERVDNEDAALEAPVDWYAVLGVAPDADLETMRDAWRALARVWHPDRSGASEAGRHRFHAVQSAWQVLGQPERRALHDAERRHWADRVAPLPRGFIERLVGVRPSEPERGRNRRCRVVLGGAEVITGRRVTLELPTLTDCQECGGTGLHALGMPVLCDRCGGRCFEVHRPVLRAVGAPCERCDAAGWVPKPPCRACQGRGRRTVDAPVSFDLPGGLRDGARVVVRGLGEPGRGGAEAGDLEVDVSIEPGAPWRIEGADWFGECEVPFWRALAGGRVEVATPWGPRIVRLPAGTCEGERLCLEGLGVERRGDGFLAVRLRWPDDLDDEEIAALVRWGEAVEARRAHGGGRGDGG
jgi:molecular chaperone DnaJ